MLPDNVLLEIFDLYVDQEEIEAWQRLAHVCHRWRTVVFGSPCRLNLRLVCTPITPARDTLDVWPALPLFIRCSPTSPIENVDNIVAVLECRNRVRQIDLRAFSSSDSKDILAAMQEPFPELAHLGLMPSRGEPVAVLPDSFLCGSAPHMRTLCEPSPFVAFHFRVYRNYFCSPLTSSIFTFMTFLILGTFHPTPWSLSSP